MTGGQGGAGRGDAAEGGPRSGLGREAVDAVLPADDVASGPVPPADATAPGPVSPADDAAPRAVLAALAAVADLRADLDRAERRLVELARERGASWREVAAALGLRSRQAAEQRWLRLRAATADGPAGDRRRDPADERRRRHRQRNIDVEPPGVAALRRHATALHDALAALPDGDDRPLAVAGLARQTLRAAVLAPPGALHDLVRWAVTDLRSVPGEALGRPVVAALARVAASLTAP